MLNMSVAWGCGLAAPVAAAVNIGTAACCVAAAAATAAAAAAAAAAVPAVLAVPVAADTGAGAINCKGTTVAAASTSDKG